MKVLVTGASGHLGANLVRRLVEDGQAIRLLLPPGDHHNKAIAGLDVECVYADLGDLPAVTAAVRGCTHVYHCAAKVSITAGREREIYNTNVIGTRHILRASAEAAVARVVVTGSFSAVGHNPSRPSDEDDPFYPFEKTMPYEVTKAFVEHECWQAAAQGLNVVVAISCAIIGPNDFMPSRMGRVLIDFSSGKLRAYVPGGFEFVAARDIAAGHVLAMNKGVSGHRYIFSTQFLTIDEMMGIFEEVTGRPRPIRLPASVMAPIAAVSSFVLTNFFPNVRQRFTPGALRILRMHRHADCTKARRELGYQPTSISQAVREAYASFVERGIIQRPQRMALSSQPAGRASS